jgi:hypothetical protein
MPSLLPEEKGVRRRNFQGTRLPTGHFSKTRDISLPLPYDKKEARY